MGAKIINRVGQKFGRLTIIEELGGNKVRCKCDCGNEIIATKTKVVNGTTQSCGCLNRDISSEIMSDLSKANESIYIGRLKGEMSTSRNTSGVRGVWLDKSRQKWVAEIKINGKKKFLGRFEKKEDAQKARKLAEDELFQPVIEEYEMEKKEKPDALIGQKFGRWLVLDISESKHGKIAKCRCECGTVKNVSLPSIVNGLSRSCGCGRKEKRKNQK